MPKQKTYATWADLKKATLEECRRRDPGFGGAPRRVLSEEDEKRRARDVEDEREARDILQKAAHTLARAEVLFFRLAKEDREGGTACKMLSRAFLSGDPAWWECFARTQPPKTAARASHTRAALTQAPLLVERISKGKTHASTTSLAVKSLLAGEWPNLRGKSTEYTPADVIGIEARAMRAAMKRARAARARESDLDE